MLERPLQGIGSVVRAKRPTRLPSVLAPDEVQQVLGFLTGKQWIVGMLLYGAGHKKRGDVGFRACPWPFPFIQQIM